jgi:hypothetical protein
MSTEENWAGRSNTPWEGKLFHMLIWSLSALEGREFHVL